MNIMIVLLLAALSFHILFFLFVTSYIGAMEKKALKVIELLPTNIKAKYIDSRVWFKGYNISKKKNKYEIGLFKTLYSFNLADLYLLNDKLIIVGKRKSFGKTRLLAPFAICWADKTFEPTSVESLTKQINTVLVGDDIEIEFKDPDYSNTMKLVVKKIGHSFYDKIKN